MNIEEQLARLQQQVDHAQVWSEFVVSFQDFVSSFKLDLTAGRFPEEKFDPIVEQVVSYVERQVLLTPEPQTTPQPSVKKKSPPPEPKFEADPEFKEKWGFLMEKQVEMVADDGRTFTGIVAGWAPNNQVLVDIPGVPQSYSCNPEILTLKQ